jgi:hypothetical protein
MLVYTIQKMVYNDLNASFVQRIGQCSSKA